MGTNRATTISVILFMGLSLVADASRLDESLRNVDELFTSFAPGRHLDPVRKKSTGVK